MRRTILASNQINGTVLKTKDTRNLMQTLAPLDQWALYTVKEPVLLSKLK